VIEFVADDFESLPVDTSLSEWEAQAIEQAERQAALWTLKTSDGGRAFLDILKEECDHHINQLTRAQADDVVLITQLQSLIHTRRNWIRRIETAEQPDWAGEQ
jgi:hypothetical protein